MDNGLRQEERPENRRGEYSPDQRGNLPSERQDDLPSDRRGELPSEQREFWSLYNELERHLLEDEKPSVYLQRLAVTPLFGRYPFRMLQKLRDTEQSPIHHPEGSAWNHTLLVVDEAARVKDRSGDRRVFLWAALLHDIGKPGTTRIRKGKITSYDHDALGEKLAAEFLAFFTDDTAFIEKVSKLVRYHMHILYVNRNLPFGRPEKLKRETSVHEVALLGYCDRMGRTHSVKAKEQESIRQFLKAMEQ